MVTIPRNSHCLCKADYHNWYDITPSTGKTVEDCPNVGANTNYMLIFFVYDATSCTVFNRESETKPNFWKQELGRVIVDLNPSHLSREVRWAGKKLARLGYPKKSLKVQKCLEQIAHGLRTKEHICVEL